MDYPMSNPDNNTPGANDKFVEGGKTSGGVHEAVFHNVPTPANNPAATQASIIHVQSHEKGNIDTFSPQPNIHDNDNSPPQVH